MSALRPLPPRPSLEFEHKEAKALLRRLRAGDPDSLERARARHSAIDVSRPESIRLADAQLVVAREYGFTSWPRLVRYFGDLDRQRHYQGNAPSGQRDFYDESVQNLLARHRDRRDRAWRVLTSYVPRFYGLPAEEVFATSLTEDEARLAVARVNGCSSWEVLLERVAQEAQRPRDQWQVDPMTYAVKAMDAVDLDELRRVVEAHPDLLHPSAYDVAKGRTLLNMAMYRERSKGVDIMRPIMDWLTSQGLDLRHELNVRLCGGMHMKIDLVRYLLDRGADPNWIAPNGFSVLEHALLHYWNGEALDLIAARAVPRKALWIAAGLGDVDGVRRFLDREGKPTAEARRLRPDFDAIGPMTMPSPPEPGDDEILMEAFMVAMLNGRVTVLEYMVSRGFPIDTLVWTSPPLHMAVGNAMTPIVECLVRCGADLDIRGYLARPNTSARDIARDMLEMFPQDAERRRIAELCGLDPDVVLAERDARPIPPPDVAPRLLEAMERAGDDAFNLGQTDVRPENLLFGLLGDFELAVYFGRVSGMDFERFRADVRDRVRPGAGRVERPKLPLRADAQATVQAAIAAATERRREEVTSLHLLYALLRDEQGAAVSLLVRYGASAEKLLAELERAM